MRDGRAPVSYRRTHPNGPWIYTGGKCVGIPIRRRQRVPGVRHRARQGRARHVQRGLHAGGDARAGAARRRADLHAGRHRQGQAVGDLAHSDLVARDREPGDRGDDAEPVQPRRARARHGGGAGGDPVREHGRRAVRSSTSASIARASCAPPRDMVTSSRVMRAKQGVLGPQWQRPELRETMYPARRGAKRRRNAVSALRCTTNRANFSAACPLAPISARSPASAIPTAASSAPPNGAPTTPRWPRSRPTARAGAYVIGGELDRCQEGRAAQRSAVHAGRGARVRAGDRDGLPRPSRRRAAASASASRRRRRKR